MSGHVHVILQIKSVNMLKCLWFAFTLMVCITFTVLLNYTQKFKATMTITKLTHHLEILRDKMYDYQMHHKIPVELSKELIDKLDNMDECPNDLISTEEKCYFCGHSLGKPKLVTSKAKLITMSGGRKKRCIPIMKHIPHVMFHTPTVT